MKIPTIMPEEKTYEPVTTKLADLESKVAILCKQSDIKIEDIDEFPLATNPEKKSLHLKG